MALLQRGNAAAQFGDFPVGSLFFQIGKPAPQFDIFLPDSFRPAVCFRYRPPFVGVVNQSEKHFIPLWLALAVVALLQLGNAAAQFGIFPLGSLRFPLGGLRFLFGGLRPAVRFRHRPPFV